MTEAGVPFQQLDLSDSDVDEPDVARAKASCMELGRYQAQ